MAMNDATKRKSPEPEDKEEKKEGAAVGFSSAKASETTATPAGSKSSAGEPEAKRLKVAPAELASVRKQVEYYLSDENLKYDKFFHEKISADSEGWLDMALVLSCNKMKAMRASKEDTLAALKESKIEVKEGGTAIRRPGNAALPTLENKPQHPKKGGLLQHEGGVLAVFKNIPAEQSWVQLKEELAKALPEKTSVWFVSEVSDGNRCFVAVAPFEGDLEHFGKMTIDLGGTKLKPEVCQGETLQQALKLLPKHIREKREKETRKRQKERNRPIIVGQSKFVNVGALRGRVKEILNSRSDGEHLKPDGSDFKLIKALLEHHPKGAQKSEGMVGIKVAPSSQGNRCFFMIKGDGSSEDFSAKKCLDALELNPPYLQDAPRQKEKKSAVASAPGEGEEAKKDSAKQVKKDESPAAEGAKKDETPVAEDVKKDETPVADDSRKDEVQKAAEEAKKDETHVAEEAKKDEAQKSEAAPAAE